MNPHLQRAQMLYERSRYEEAERELGMSLTQDPEEPWAYALMGACKSARKDFAQVDELGQRAMALAPDSADIRHLVARIQLARNDLPAAERIVSEAIQLDPQAASMYALRAMVHAKRSHWDKALIDCQAALELDPENMEAINVQALARRGKGDTRAATAELEKSLQLDPEDAWSHANLGWTHLQADRLDEAEKHFREALRLEPELDWARVGVLETLKARIPVYRWILGYFLWMGRQTKTMQWAIIIGFFLLSRIVRAIGEANPAVAPFVWPIIALYILFCVVSWIAKPLSDGLLICHPLGRLALTQEERQQGLTTLTLFLLTLAFIGWAFIAPGPVPIACTLGVGSAGLALILSFQIRHPKPRRWMQWGATATACLAAIAITVAIAPDWVEDKWPVSLQQLVVLPALRVLPFAPLAIVLGANFLYTQQWRD